MFSMWIVYILLNLLIENFILGFILIIMCLNFFEICFIVIVN